MKAIFVVTHGSSSKRSRPMNEITQVMESLYGKDVYVQLGGDTPDHAIQSIARTSTIESIEDKVVEIGPYLVKYKLVKTT